MGKAHLPISHIPLRPQAYMSAVVLPPSTWIVVPVM